MQATKPVQEHLGMMFDQKRHQYRMALYLPSPLYVLYVQATAYAEACGECCEGAIYSSSQGTHLRATERHLPYEITQCYLPHDTGERTPAITPARQAGT